MRCCGAADTAPRRIPLMAQEAGEAPGSHGSVSTTSAGMWGSRQAQMHAPCFLSCNPYAAGAADPAALGWAAADSRVLSHRVPGDAWTQNVPGRGGMHGFLSLLEGRNESTPEMFEDVPEAPAYLTALGVASNMAGQAPDAGYGLAIVDDRYTGASSAPPMKPQTAASPLTSFEDGMVHGSSGEVKRHKPHNRQRELGGGTPMAALLQEMTPSSVEMQSGLANYTAIGAERLMETYAARSLSAGSSSFSDYRSTEEFMFSSGQEQDIITPEMASGSSGNGTTRRKSEERAGGSTKKTKREVSKTSPPKPQEANMKLGERITALQQIVSPFGKTDRASVLSETIKYIKFLHDQIQLFSESYMTKSTHKGRIQFGIEEKPATQHDLRGSGLCLVPVSWTSQLYRDDTLPDCWSPAYRSCLYQ